MNEYEIFIRHPFFKHSHTIKAQNILNALDIVRSRYNVTDEKHRNYYIITSVFENGNKIITEQKLFR